jgi:hypothetical protein
MGITSGHINLLCLLAKKVKLSGTVVTLGRQKVYGSYQQIKAIFSNAGIPADHLVESSPEVMQEAIFKSLGFSQVLSVDVSDYEWPDFKVDLNDATPPPEVIGIADMIYDGGTLEHVFDTRAGLINIHKMLKVGGVVVHDNPINGFVNHGFYQYSPTLYYDYYLENKYEGIMSVLVELEDPLSGPWKFTDTINSIPVQTSERAFEPDSPMKFLSERMTMGAFYVARRKAESTGGRIPSQASYRDFLWIRNKAPG